MPCIRLNYHHSLTHQTLSLAHQNLSLTHLHVGLPLSLLPLYIGGRKERIAEGLIIMFGFSIKMLWH